MARQGRPRKGPQGERVSEYPALKVRLHPDVLAELRRESSVSGKPAWRLIQSAVCRDLEIEDPEVSPLAALRETIASMRRPESPAPITDIVIACGEKKVTHHARADELYLGPLWSTWRRQAPDPLPPSWRLWALSAQHGLISAALEVEPYEKRLRPEDEATVAEMVRNHWRELNEVRTSEGRETSGVVMVGGKSYQRVAELANLPILTRIDGTKTGNGSKGIGVMRRRLSDWIKTAVRD